MEQLSQLTAELQRVRQDSLAASRRGDFRAVARLTTEAARLNQMILAAEGSQVPALHGLGDKLFSSHTDEPEEKMPAFANAELELAGAA